MSLAFKITFGVLLLAVVVWNWNRADMHSVDRPFRRVAVAIGAILGTLRTMLRHHWWW